MTISERELIAQIKSQTRIDEDRIVLGIGDDCAVYHLSENSAETKFGIITTDALIESVHFDLSWHPAKLLGRKSLAVNLSDIAAMGGVPLYALLTVGLPDDAKSGLINDFMEGFQELLAEHNVLLIGGDTVKNPGFMISVTVLGEVEKEHVAYRSGAKAGDLIWVSGFLGQAAAGLEICRRKERVSNSYKSLVKAHLNPLPCTTLGPLLAGSEMVTAMMDISDGVATDLAHMCKESKVSAEIDADVLPISNETALAAAELDFSALDWALKGGEDYELLFTSPSSLRENLPNMINKRTGQDIFCIGTVQEGQGVYLKNSGRLERIDYNGYDHFRL